MSDVIRKAVELADGWKYDEIGHTGKYKIHLPDTMQTWVDFNYQPALDALAAQLVRQVDVLDEYRFNFARRGTMLKPRIGGHLLGYCKGDDRTMNTIKAIVDSGVLEPPVKE